MKIGLLGVGLLGSAVAECFRSAGFEWVGYDPARPDLVGSAEEVIQAADAVVLCLPDSTYTPPILPLLARTRLVIDATTGEPAEMAGFADSLAQSGTAYVDATVGGSSIQVRDGSAIVMAGATDSDFQLALPLLRAISEHPYHCGPPGAGARMKLVFNLVLGLNRAALAEGLAFAERAGVDAKQAFEILRSGPAASRIMDRKGPKMLDRNFAPEARLAQHHKDVRLILAEAANHGLRLPLEEAHDEILERAERLGLGADDNSALIEAYRRDSVMKL